MTTSTPAQAAATLPGAGGKHTVSSAPTSPAKAGTNLTTSISFSERNKRFEMANTNRLVRNLFLDVSFYKTLNEPFGVLKVLTLALVLTLQIHVLTPHASDS